MSDWREDYETNPSGVNPHDYDNQDDFMDSLRNNERRMKEQQNAKKSEGCYIATCVYGSYDCPQVLVLRSYRDNILQNSSSGRAFIKAYYALSPKLVSAFGQTKIFRAFFKKILDRFVAKLEESAL